ncbi:hypothetical protein ALI22I_06280 [Saccharothrix sp. ALI-22-I]|uniref:RICIN domain-containing protein n=1 Tax=Saccharothrix sp. ALI-22-I TaxID=1933778 RepID=UPI00097CAA6C|nr:RICIN domain-containing protein [Saccharothrix sp. ALI-22-I]ONI92038.1 hypothetical protein ALI22I_06280 [Saccharothrix sp. ALI-22-I]
MTARITVVATAGTVSPGRPAARHSGKCLDALNAATADGVKLVQWTCTGGTNQQWQRKNV